MLVGADFFSFVPLVDKPMLRLGSGKSFPVASEVTAMLAAPELTTEDCWVLAWRIDDCADCAMRIDKSIGPGVNDAEFFVAVAPVLESSCDFVELFETEFDGVLVTEACWADEMRFVAWAIKVGKLISLVESGLDTFPESAGSVVADEAGSLLEDVFGLVLCAWTAA